MAAAVDMARVGGLIVESLSMPWSKSQVHTAHCTLLRREPDRRRNRTRPNLSGGGGDASLILIYRANWESEDVL